MKRREFMSAHRTSRQFAATEHIGRYLSEADMNPQAKPAGSVKNDPRATSGAALGKLYLSYTRPLPVGVGLYDRSTFRMRVRITGGNSLRLDTTGKKTCAKQLSPQLHSAHSYRSRPLRKIRSRSDWCCPIPASSRIPPRKWITPSSYLCRRTAIGSQEKRSRFCAVIPAGSRPMLPSVSLKNWSFGRTWTCWPDGYSVPMP